MKRATRTFLPKNRIEALVLRPGGIPREKALEQAAAAVEELRDGSIKGIPEAIERIEARISTAASGHLTADEMHEILRFGDRIILLSETFGFALLATVAMRLCDLVERLIAIGRGDVEAVRVCVRVLRLVAPPHSTLSEKDSDAMMRELARILAHYGVRSESSFGRS